MKIWAIAAALCVVFGGAAHAQAQTQAIDPAVMKELAPTGKLRVGIAVGPAPSALYSLQDPDGKRRGVTIELGTALAKKLGVPVEWVAYLGTGEIQASASSGAWDVAFAPVDDERKKLMEFGNAYHLLQSTYLVAPGSKIMSVPEANAAGVRIAGVRDTATLRASMRTAPNATHIALPGVDAAIELVKDGKADAIPLQPGVARRRRGQASGLARARRRLSQLDDGDRGAEGQACGARLRERIHRGGEGIGPGPPRARRCRTEGLPGGAGRHEALISTQAFQEFVPNY